MPFTRTYNWGESLRLEAAMADGGLKAATDRIASTMGRAYGSRNTFATLFDSGTGRWSRRRSTCGVGWSRCGCRWRGVGTPAAHNLPYVNLGMWQFRHLTRDAKMPPTRRPGASRGLEARGPRRWKRPGYYGRHSHWRQPPSAATMPAETTALA